MDDLRLFRKSDGHIDSLVQTVLTFSEDICMEFGVVILKKEMRSGYSKERETC